MLIQLVMISATFALVSVRKTNTYYIIANYIFYSFGAKIVLTGKILIELSKKYCTRKLLPDNFFLKQILHVNKINFDTFLALYFTVCTYLY